MGKRKSAEQSEAQDRDEWREYRQRGKPIEREEDELIYALDQSFLKYEESFWIEHVNYDDDYPGLADHVISLLNRYLDALKEDRPERLKVFAKIAQEINEKMQGLTMPLAPNPDFGEGDTRPFWEHKHDTDAQDIYWSVGRFLSSPYARRLGRCRHCRGLFIAPDDFKYKHCPGTDHYHRQHDSTVNPKVRIEQRERMRKQRAAKKPYAL